jgi:threonyl-tRNA synthetase
MNIVLKNGEKREIKKGENGFQVAKEILKPEEVKNAIAYKLNDVLYDLSEPIIEDGNFEIIDKANPEALNILNHSTSHLLAQAIQHLYPEAKFGIGPSIDEGFYYDIDFKEPLVDTDFPKIEQEMKKIAKENLKIEKEIISKKAALELFKDNPYKVELIKDLKGKIIIRKQGDFTDLCGGVHVPSTGYIKHFKLLSLAGAYWRGNSDNKQLTRIYGTSFFSDEDLQKYLMLIEERKQRDHRKLGRELGLFMISEYGPGFPFWLPNGMILRNELENFWYKRHEQAGYVFVKTPIILSKELWVTSGHWANYKQNMYTTKIDDKEYAIKPMNCPGSILVYKNSLHSYKDLPIRMGELGLVHRHEASGALNGLFRVRTFTQDDAHIFCREDQLQSEIQDLLKLYDELYTMFGLDYHIELSTKPEKDYIGDDRIWEKSEEILAKACQASGKEFIINKGDGAFYGPKLDFKLRDSMNRIWQCGTIQLDMNLPIRFDMTYIDEHNEKVRPIMLHRALFGSIERFIGILIEHYGGAFPTWLSPVQVNVLPVNNLYHLGYAHKVIDDLKKADIRVTLDDSEEKLGYRLRNSQVKKIPFTVVIGDKEKEDGTVTYRIFGTEKQITVSEEDFIKRVRESIDKKARW